MALTTIKNLNLASSVTGTLPTANGGTGATSFSPGKLLQTISDTKTNTTQSTSSTSFVASSLTIDITPSATSSKILLFLNGGQMYTPANRALHVTIYRDSTNLGDATRGMARMTVGGGGELLAPHSIHFLDSPNSSSQKTYTVYFESDDGSTVYLSTGSAGTMSFTAMEIGA